MSKIDQNVYEHVKKYNEEKGYTTDDDSIFETIQECGTFKWKGDEDSHRWWNTYTYVVELNGMLIGYENAETTGDISASDLGYEIDYSSIREYEKKEKIVTIYCPKQ